MLTAIKVTGAQFHVLIQYMYSSVCTYNMHYCTFILCSVLRISGFNEYLARSRAIR